RMQQPEGDVFRSNAGKRRRLRTLLTLIEQEQATMILSVESLGLELGAVDFAYTAEGRLVVFEVNFPFAFGSVLTKLQYDLPGAMVAYLQKKSSWQA
ncbi:MAG: hypothetical protein AAB538_02775, partial [Patescibacteria group bacterium]